MMWSSSAEGFSNLCLIPMGMYVDWSSASSEVSSPRVTFALPPTTTHRFGAVEFQCRHRRRRRRVAAAGLEDDFRRRDAGLPRLLGDNEPVFLVADEHRPGVPLISQARRRFLQKGRRCDQRQELFRVKRPRHWPQPRSRSAAKDDRMNVSAQDNPPCSLG